MERIKQALQKARSEPNQGLQPIRRVGPAVSSAASASSRTRQVDLDLSTLESSRIVALDRRNPVAARFDVLRTKLLQRMDDSGWRTLALTSPSARSGATVVATNLAISIARQPDRTALLVDFDLRSPGLARCLGLKGGRSVNDVLGARACFADALVHPNIPRLVIAPAYGPEADCAESLSSERTRSMLREIRDRYADRIIIFVLPPLLGTDDALAVMPLVDCVLLVVGDGLCTQQEVAESLRQIPGEKLIGTVLNNCAEQL